MQKVKSFDSFYSKPKTRTKSWDGVYNYFINFNEKSSKDKKDIIDKINKKRNRDVYYEDIKKNQKKRGSI